MDLELSDCLYPYATGKIVFDAIIEEGKVHHMEKHWQKSKMFASKLKPVSHRYVAWGNEQDNNEDSGPKIASQDIHASHISENAQSRMENMHSAMKTANMHSEMRGSNMHYEMKHENMQSKKGYMKISDSLMMLKSHMGRRHSVANKWMEDGKMKTTRRASMVPSMMGSSYSNVGMEEKLKNAKGNQQRRQSVGQNNLQLQIERHRKAMLHEKENHHANQENDVVNMAENKLFEVESMLRMDMRCRDSISVQQLLNRIEDSFSFLRMLEEKSSQQQVNIGIVFQQLRSKANIRNDGQLINPFSENACPLFNDAMEDTEQKLCMETQNIIKLLRVKIEDASDLGLARTALHEAKKCFQSLLHITDSTPDVRLNVICDRLSNLSQQNV